MSDWFVKNHLCKELFGLGELGDVPKVTDSFHLRIQSSVVILLNNDEKGPITSSSVGVYRSIDFRSSTESILSSTNKMAFLISEGGALIRESIMAANIIKNVLLALI